MRRDGFTLLEVLVATTIMGIAVISLLSTLATSARNSSRATDYERVAMLARAQMDALLADPHLPKFVPIQQSLDPSLLGGMEGGWRARVSPFEMPPNAGPNSPILERIELEVWWMRDRERRSFALEGFRRSVLRPEDMASAGVAP